MREVISLPSMGVHIDNTIKSLEYPKFAVPAIIEDVFSGLVIDSNYRIIFSSKEISRYEKCVSELLGIYVVVDAPRFKLTREVGVVSHLPLFSRVDIGEREFLAVLNPLISAIIYEGKFVLLRRDKRQSRYSVRLENFLKKYETGIVEIKLSALVRELNASATYAKSYGQFFARVLKEAIENINNNDNGVYVLDCGHSSIENVIWFKIERNER